MVNIKRQRSRIKKITMALAVVILTVVFLLSVSGQGMADVIGENDLDPKKVQSEDWTIGENEKYIACAMNIYETLLKYQTGTYMMEKKEFREELTESDQDQTLAYYIDDSPEFQKYKDQVSNDSFYDSEQASFLKSVSYEIDQNLLLVYNNATESLNIVFPYHLSETSMVHELEKNGLTGLSSWMKKVESVGIKAKTKDQKEIIVPDLGYSRMFDGIQVDYDISGLTFTFNRSFALQYQYLDNMNESVKKIGWTVHDIMSESYEKGLRCYVEDFDHIDLDAVYSLIPSAELIADKEQVKELCICIPHNHVRDGEQLITVYKEEIKGLLEYAGMDSGKAEELIEELTCGSNQKNGVKGGFLWNLEKNRDYSYENSVYGDYVLILSKAK